MTDQPLREPDQIRQDCARKFRAVEVSGMFAAILACLLDQDWTDPKIEELRITFDRCLMAQTEGDIGFNLVLGAEADLIRNIHGVAEVAELDGDEVGYLLGRVAEIRGWRKRHIAVAERIFRFQRPASPFDRPSFPSARS